MVIFNSYVKLPQGSRIPELSINQPCFGSHCLESGSESGKNDGETYLYQLHGKFMKRKWPQKYGILKPFYVYETVNSYFWKAAWGFEIFWDGISEEYLLLL